MSGALPDAHGQRPPEVQVQEVLHLMCDLKPEALADHHVPGGAELLVHRLFDHLGGTLERGARVRGVGGAAHTGSLCGKQSRGRRRPASWPCCPAPEPPRCRRPPPARSPRRAARTSLPVRKMAEGAEQAPGWTQSPGQLFLGQYQAVLRTVSHRPRAPWRLTAQEIIVTARRRVTCGTQRLFPEGFAAPRRGAGLRPSVPQRPPPSCAHSLKQGSRGGRGPGFEGQVPGAGTCRAPAAPAAGPGAM